MGKHVVKSSDISRDLRVTEFMNREPLNLGSPAKRKAAERLIDQALIRDQIVNGGYARPTEADGERLLKQLQQDRFGGSDARLRQTTQMPGRRCYAAAVGKDDGRRQGLSGHGNDIRNEHCAGTC